MNQQLRNALAGMMTTPVNLVPENYGFTRSLPDADDPTIFTRVVYVRRDGTKIIQSDLIEKVNGKYMAEIVKYFADDGVTVIDTVTWDYSYDNDIVQSKIIRQTP